MKWKYVFNTNLRFFAGATIKGVADFVKTTGYKFFTFNGEVCDLNCNYIGITIDELF